MSDVQSESLASHVLRRLGVVVWQGRVATSPDEGWELTFVSPEVEELLGYPAARCLEKGFLRTRVPPADRARLLDTYRAVAADGQHREIEYRMVAADGREVWLLDSVRAVTASGEELRGLMFDITARRHARGRSEDALRSLIQNASFGIYRMTPEGRLLDANRGLVEMLGYDSAHELLRVDMANDVWQEPRQQRRFVDFQKRRGRIAGLEVNWKRKDGRVIRVRLTGRAVPNDQGQLEACEVIAEDVTHRKRLEEKMQEARDKRLEQQLREVQKMEAVGRLAGGIAHDFNNLLTVILGYADALTDNHVDRDLESEAPRAIRAAAERAADLTRQLLAFCRKQKWEPKVLDCNQLLGDLANLLRRLVGENTVLTMRLDPMIRAVRADPGHLEQAILNLVVNARDAMPEGGSLLVETTNVDLDDAYASDRVDTYPGPHVRIRVRDTGTGMDEETRSRVFEPFFTTKAPGRGTGLGLATVYGTVNQNGGHITVASEPGRGSTFDIHLPCVAETVRGDAPAGRHGPTAHGGETVLVVEDEPEVLKLTARILEMAGYRVLSAGSAAAAMSTCEAAAAEIDLVLTDVVMPDVSGVELAAWLVGSHPDLRVLFMSGHADERLDGLGIQEGLPAFLQKPFTPEVLLAKVREVLRESPALR